MKATAKRKPRTSQASWWTLRSNRNLLWLALLGAGLVALAMVFVFNRDGGGGGSASSRFDPIHTFDTADVHALAFDQANPDRLVFGHHNGILASDDGGRTWDDLVERQNFDGMNLVFDPSHSSTLYLAGHDILSKSEDGGATWQSFEHDLPGLDLHAFAASSSTPGRFYAFAVGQGLLMSEGGASRWTRLWAAPPGTHSIVEVGAESLVLGAADGGILRSDDGGKTWTGSRGGIDTGVIFSVKADAQARKVYAGTSHGLFVSTDGGRTWAPTALNDAQIISVGVNPANPDQVMAIDRGGRLYASNDSGANWAQ